MANISGIYKIESKIHPERFYIGSAVNIADRWRLHLLELRRNNHRNSRLQNHYNKYGDSDFSFSILLGCDKQDLLKIEQYFLDSCNPWFNICKTAGSKLGVKATEETRRKLSVSHKGKPSNMKGKRHTKEAKEQNRLKHIGKTPWNKGLKNWMIPWNKGLTKETDERVRLYGEKESQTKLGLNNCITINN
jgi:group I intron endonuclease